MLLLHCYQSVINHHQLSFVQRFLLTRSQSSSCQWKSLPSGDNFGNGMQGELFSVGEGIPVSYGAKQRFDCTLMTRIEWYHENITSCELIYSLYIFNDRRRSDQYILDLVLIPCPKRSCCVKVQLVGSGCVKTHSLNYYLKSYQPVWFYYTKKFLALVACLHGFVRLPTYKN